MIKRFRYWNFIFILFVLSGLVAGWRYFHSNKLSDVLEESSIEKDGRQQIALFKEWKRPGVDYAEKVYPIRTQLVHKRRISTEDVTTLLAGINGPADQLIKGTALSTIGTAFDLGGVPDSSRPPIQATCLQGLHSKDLLVREGCASVLGKLNDKSVVPALLPLLNDPAYHVRRVAGKSLRKLGYYVPVEPRPAKL